MNPVVSFQSSCFNFKLPLEIWIMFHREICVRSCRVFALLLLSMMLAQLSSRPMFAQHGGGGGGIGGGASSGGGGRPGGVSEKDELKDFHRVMAVMATPDQKTTFNVIAHDLQIAIDQLQTFRDSLQKAPAVSSVAEHATTLDQAIEKARTGNQRFLASLSRAQDSGLKEISKQLAKADFDLTKQVKALDQTIQSAPSDYVQIGSSAANLDKALVGFQNEQLALGREMSVLVTSSDDLAFNLPRTTNSITISGQPVAMSASGTVSRTSAENGRNVFSLRMIADFSGVQQSLTGILRSEIDRTPRCGEHLQVLDATLTPQFPASLMVLHLHYERWICPPSPARDGPIEVSDGNATMEIKLSPTLAPSSGEPGPGVHLVAEIGHVEADGVLRSMLRSGDLGTTLREQITAALLPVMQRAVDLKSLLRVAGQQSATLQKIEFQDAGAGGLSLVMDGQLKLSDDQTKEFAAQLKQRQSAQVPSAK
jgi:hypothetical protein